jgi:hypothetical protein
MAGIPIVILGKIVGWDGGSALLQAIVVKIDRLLIEEPVGLSLVAPRLAERLYSDLIEVFEEFGCDTVYELLEEGVGMPDAFELAWYAREAEADPDFEPEEEGV